MKNKHTTVGKKAYLKTALIFFAFWLFLAFVIFNNMREPGGLPGLMNEVGNGGYSDLILLVLSVFFLAKFFQSLSLYFRFKNDD